MCLDCCDFICYIIDNIALSGYQDEFDELLLILNDSGEGGRKGGRIST